MTYCEETQTYRAANTRKHWIDMPAIRLLIAGVYFMLGLGRDKGVPELALYDPVSDLASRPARRLAAHAERRAVNARDLSVLRPFVPGGAHASRRLTRTQFLERCTRLSVMGRLQIYDFHYYRRAFRLRRTLRRLSAPKSAAQIFSSDTDAITQTLSECTIPP